MKLVLGCGDKAEKGAVNHDVRIHSSWVDVAHDLNEYPWPWEDDEFDEVYASMVLEHLQHVIPFMDECHRILEPGGSAEIIVPHYRSDNVVIDPTHVRGFHPDSMDFFDDSTGWGKKAWFYTDKKWRVTERNLGANGDPLALRWKMVTV